MSKKLSLKKKVLESESETEIDKLTREEALEMLKQLQSEYNALLERSESLN